MNVKRTPIVAGNWKMNLNLGEGIELVAQLVNHYENLPDPQVDVILAPSYVHLHAISEMTSDIDFIHVASQALSQNPKGAFTGEVSAAMIASTGATYTLVGHSEQRMMHIRNESVELIHQMDLALMEGLGVIYCVGENETEYENGKTEEVIAEQLRALNHRTPEQMRNITLAYEPVWAIGTGNTATPELANSVHSFIRNSISNKFGPQSAEQMRILYGGSCNPSNAAELFTQPHIDGGLIGGASLNAESFISLIDIANNEI
jgi:triosephosphate isomerase